MAAYPPIPGNTLGTQIWTDQWNKTSYSVIGQAGFKRYDGADKASGRGLFTRDIILPGMLYAVPLVSPYAHVNITAMDATDAQNYPGVRYVLTYNDPEIKGKLNSSGGLKVWMLGSQQYYSGGPIGAVIVADTEQIAREALRLLKITWVEAPAITDVELAADPSAPQAVDGVVNDTNVNTSATNPMNFGDITAGFAAADKTITADFKKMCISGASAEPQSCVVKWDGKGVLEFWHHTQVPNSHRAKLAAYFAIPKSMTNCHQVYNGHLGGHFQWMSYDSWTIPLLAAILARRIGRPIKYMYDRKDDFTACAPSTCAFHAKVGYKNDGTITAIQSNNYLSISGFNSWEHIKENTSIQNYNVRVHNVLHNVPHPGPMRCEQTNNAQFWGFIQNLVAAAANVDPTKMALLQDGFNGQPMATEGKAFKAAHGYPARDSLAECITKGNTAFGWTSKYHAPNSRTQANGRMHGAGFFWDHSWQDASGDSGCAIMFNQDGSVSVLSQIADNGVNQRSTMNQIICEELGITADILEWLNQGQETVNFCTGPGSGSQTLCCNGWAFKYAARNAKATILDFCCHDFQYSSGFGSGAGPSLQKAFFPGKTAADLDLQNNVIFLKSDPTQKFTLKQVCVNTTFGGHNAGQSNMGPGQMAWQYVSQPALADTTSKYEARFLGRQAHWAEVEVDTETGEIYPLMITSVIDCGKMINPEGLYGQMYGGTYMAWGRAVVEEHLFDPATSVLLNCNLYDYKVATIKDLLPSALNMNVIETGLGRGPYGAIGVGESNATVVHCAVGAAVYNAIGVWINDFPITPAKVLKALGKA